MFEQTFVQTRAQSRNPWSLALSLSLQCGAVAIVLLIPLLHPETLRIPDPPKPRFISAWIAPPPVQARRATTAAPATAAPAAYSHPLYVPPTLRSAAVRSVSVSVADAAPSAWAAAPAGFAPALSLAAALPAAAPVKPPAPVRVAPAAPMHVSGGVEAAKLLFSPHPDYPRLALLTHAQGTVRLEAVIAADGGIRNLRVLSGSQLLVDAAVNAVKRWKYQPTLLNGVPVEVVTEIEVNFTLNR